MNRPLRCAVYARFSTDKQNPLSIQDQGRKCREFAKARGWLVLDEHIYSDEAVSGASRNRVGLRQLLRLAESPRPPFEAILAEDSSRLSRRQADVLDICERLILAEIRICFVSQGIDSQDEKFQFMIAARGMIDRVFLADTSKRVHRGMEGLVSRGRHTGGRCFGYASQKVDGGTELAIHGEQAAIVRRVFSMYANGSSLKRIAETLNAEGVPAPHAQRGRVSRSWCPSSLQHMLKNPRYMGKVIWNTTQKVRDPRTGKRVKRPRPGSEWMTREAPHLRPQHRRAL